MNIYNKYVFYYENIITIPNNYNCEMQFYLRNKMIINKTCYKKLFKIQAINIHIALVKKI